MKTFTQHINENNENLKIIELSYFDFIDLCNIYKSIDFKDDYDLSICDIINQVKNQPEEFSIKSNKYHFLAAIKDNKLIGVFYKQLIGNPNIYDKGYIISKKAGKELLRKMKSIGSFTTFSNVSNIPSMKSQLSVGAEIIYICDNPPDKSNGTYNKEFSESIKELLINEKLYYKDGDEKFYFLDDKGKLKINELKNFLLTHTKIDVVDKANIGKKIKIYFLFNKQ